MTRSTCIDHGCGTFGMWLVLNTLFGQAHVALALLGVWIMLLAHLVLCLRAKASSD
jgi:hypothetical protein